MSIERLYPETLLGIYFNLCRSGDEEVSLERLNKFADEIQGYYEANDRTAEATTFFKKNKESK